MSAGRVVSSRLEMKASAARNIVASQRPNQYPAHRVLVAKVHFALFIKSDPEEIRVKYEEISGAKGGTSAGVCIGIVRK